MAVSDRRFRYIIRLRFGPDLGPHSGDLHSLSASCERSRVTFCCTSVSPPPRALFPCCQPSAHSSRNRRPPRRGQDPPASEGCVGRGPSRDSARAKRARRELHQPASTAPTPTTGFGAQRAPRHIARGPALHQVEFRSARPWQRLKKQAGKSCCGTIVDGSGRQSTSRWKFRPATRGAAT